MVCEGSMSAAELETLLRTTLSDPRIAPAHYADPVRVRQVIGNFLLERETNSGRAFQLALAEGAGVGYEFEQAFLKNLDNVTPQSLQKVAQKYLENSTLIIARPPGRFYWDL